MTLRLGAMTAAAVVLSCGLAQGATLLDTLNSNGQPFDAATNPGGISFFNLINVSSVQQDPLGQSFTLADETTDLAISAYLSTFGSSIDVTASLVQGAGVTGAELGSDTFVLSGTNRDEASLATFDFSGLGALAAGTYTISFSGDGALGGGEQGVETAGTEAYGPNGVFDFGTNFAQEFGIRVEGEQPAPIPLPAGVWLLLGGIAALGAARRTA